MKCPRCGHWNKPSFPRCFKCGEPLNARQEKDPDWREQFERPQPAKIREVYDDTVVPVEDVVTEEQKASTKEAEALAVEMTRLKDRRARGEMYLQELRQNAAEKGIAPSGTNVSIRRGGGFFDVPDNPDVTVRPPDEEDDFFDTRVVEADMDEPAERPPFYDTEATAEIVTRRKRRKGDYVPQVTLPENPFASYDADLPPHPDSPGALAPSPYRRSKRSRIRGPILVAYLLVGILILAVAAFAVYIGISYLLPELTTRRNVTESLDNVFIEEAIVDNHPGHRILVSGEEGSKVYIAELMKSYVIVGGVATIEIADHIFYDSISPLEIDTMDISLTPTLIRSDVDTRMEPIEYTIDIPASPIKLIKPEATEITVNTSIYTMEMQVAPNSKVWINGEDVSDQLSDIGMLTHNPPVQAIGNNVISITVRAPYCRETNMAITLYRAPTDITLELDPTTYTRSSLEKLRIHGTSEAEATITVETPYYDEVNTEALATEGRFWVDVQLTKVGDNLIRIRASAPGREDAVLEHTVYYLPPVDTYSRKAWLFKRAEYNELLGNIQKRIENAQIYECIGTITEIMSENPQMAMMDATSDGNPQMILLQNSSDKTWEVGKRYKVYADVSGVYNNVPRLIGRYTYTVE